MPRDLSTIEEIRAYSGDEEVIFVASVGLRACYLGEPLNIRRALRVRGHWLIDTQGDPGNWWMGGADADGTIRVWGQYGPLSDAINGL